MLELLDLHKRYGEIQALDGCSFAVEPGRMLGFLGPNGAGKTTAMRAIFGLIRLDSGSVLWNGKPIGPEERLRFGYMPEQRGLYPKMRIRPQLAYLARLHGMEASRAQEAADRWLEELGLTDRATDPLETLSHGNQQRVQLAAALVSDPEVLVLDEPFNGLDPIGAETMSEVLRRRAEQGASVVFSSHQLDLVEDLCDDVAIIHRGKVVLTGAVRVLKDRSPHRIVEIELAGGQHPRLDGAEGVISSSFDGHTHRLVVSSDLDAHALLSRIGSDGGIRHFAYAPPSLSDLFREAVA